MLRDEDNKYCVDCDAKGKYCNNNIVKNYTKQPGYLESLQIVSEYVVHLTKKIQEVLFLIGGGGEEWCVCVNNHSQE